MRLRNLLITYYVKRLGVISRIGHSMTSQNAPKRRLFDVTVITVLDLKLTSLWPFALLGVLPLDSCSSFSRSGRTRREIRLQPSSWPKFLSACVPLLDQTLLGPVPFAFTRYVHLWLGVSKMVSPALHYRSAYQLVPVDLVQFYESFFSSFFSLHCRLKNIPYLTYAAHLNQPVWWRLASSLNLILLWVFSPSWPAPFRYLGNPAPFLVPTHVEFQWLSRWDLSTHYADRKKR